jgi:hypothetical protein
MTMSNYLCHIVGEQPERVARMHASTVKRTKAFAIAIHIPVMLWAVTGYVIASKIFGVEPWAAAAIALFCSGLIYMVERVVLATPKVWYVNVSRVVIGLVISVLGASTVDLVIFDREVTQQLREVGETQIRANHDKALEVQRQVVAQKKTDWLKAQDAANCEANGTCGSMVRSVGPVYRELARQAETMKSEYMVAQAQLGDMSTQKGQAIVTWREMGNVGSQAGLLTRVEALHQYTTNNTAAFVAWMLFFVLVLFFELMVVLAKLVFGETVDDELDQIRERISQQKARAYMEAVTSPVANARQLLESTYS